MYHGNTKITALIFLAMISTVIALIFIQQHYQTIIVDIPKFNHQQNIETRQIQSSSSPNTLYTIPATLMLPVPFTPQAPTANWDELHNEACEEASAIMAAAYFAGSTDVNLKPDYVESEIAKLTKWQEDNFGYYLDATSAETAQMIEEVYGLNTKLINDFTEQDIKKELAVGHLVIISEYGRALGNPYYKRPGPIHHMLLIKGYDSNGFITNDPGTKRGLNYPYSFDVLYAAAADWDHAQKNVDQNKKIAIIVWK